VAVVVGHSLAPQLLLFTMHMAMGQAWWQWCDMNRLVGHSLAPQPDETVFQFPIEIGV
jgi:hypothetical protein